MSVVICTYNGANRIRRAVESVLQQQDPPEFEVIIVDSASPDRTAEVCHALVQGSPPVRYVREPVPGLSRARNRGLREARGDIVAFLDDDAEVVPTWAGAIAGCLAETGADAVGGRVLARPDGVVPPWLRRARRFGVDDEGSWDLGAHRLGPVNMVIGANMAFTGPCLQRLCFPEQLGSIGQRKIAGDETLVCHRLRAAGAAIYYDPEATALHHIDPRRWRFLAYVRQLFWAGLGKTLTDRQACALAAQPATRPAGGGSPPTAWGLADYVLALPYAAGRLAGYLVRVAKEPGQ